MNKFFRWFVGLPPHKLPLTKNYSVTVVIPAWNEEEFLGDTIDSIKAQTYPCKIIVVDDCSTDETANIARLKNVHLISLKEKAGSKSRAINKAIPLVETDIVIVVDADTILKKDAIENLMVAFEDDDVVIACGAVKSINRKNWWQGARSAEYSVGQHIFKSAQEHCGIVFVMSGCFSAIRTQFAKDHPFDERTMAEDMDITWEAICSKKKVRYVQNAVCFVHDPFSWYTYKNQVERWFRGFFQNIKVRNWNLGWKLSLVIYFYMFFNLISVPMMFALLYFAFTTGIHILTYVAVWLGIMFLYVVLAERTNPLYLFVDMTRYTAMAYVNWFLYLKSFVKEIIKKER